MVPTIIHQVSYSLSSLFTNLSKQYADRQAADVAIKSLPTIKALAIENRNFLRRMVQYLAGEEGIRQFIDVGSGLPTAKNTHEVAAEAVKQKGERGSIACVYVDKDPTALACGRHILSMNESLNKQLGTTAIMLEGNVADMDAIFANREVHRVIDFSKPIAVIFMAVFHFCPTDIARRAIDKAFDACPSGSFFVVNHVTGDDQDPKTVQGVVEVYKKANQLLVWRSKPEVEDLIKRDAGWELIGPGIQKFHKFHIVEELKEETDKVTPTGYGYGCVAKKF